MNFSFFRRPAVIGASTLLLLEAVVFYAWPKTEVIPLSRPLAEVPQSIGDWRMVQESQLDTEVLDLLKADDTLNRIYADHRGQNLSLYVAFFKTQRTGVAPHSPKVCLPGNGWTPVDSGTVPVSLAGQSTPMVVNRYVVANGENKSVVLYWYQTPYRVIASEYSAKVYSVLDGLRYRRSDTSLVRIVVPAGNDVASADKIAVQFVQSISGTLRNYLPQA